MKQNRGGSARGTLIIVCGLVALTQASWGLIVPVLPVYAKQFHASAAELGLVVSAFNMARLAVNIPAGFLADRFDRRAIVLIAACGVGVTLALTSAAENLTMLFVMRVLLGLFGGVVITVGQSLLADLTDGKGRGQAMATLQAFQLAGGSLGPALGGITAGLAGPRASYLVAAALSLTMVSVAAWRLPSVAAHTAKAKNSNSGSVLQLFRDPSYVASGLVGFTIFFVRFGGQQTLVALIAYSWAGLSSTSFGIALSVMTLLNLLQVRTVGRMSDKSRKLPIVASLMVTGVGYIVFSFAHNWTVFFVALVIVGVANGFSGSVPAAYCADVVPARFRGSGIGFYRTFGDLGGLFGPILLGAVIDWRGNGVAAWLVAAVATVAAVTFALMAKETVGKRATWRPIADYEDAPAAATGTAEPAVAS